jgi:CRISPR-associated protein Csd1
MILGALAAYYDRRRQQGGDDAPPPFGFAPEKVSFALVLTSAGGLKRVLDLRESDAKGRPQPVSMQVPRPLGVRTSGIRAYFLCDNTKYVLGAGGNRPERDRQTFAAFRDKHLAYLADSDDPGALALARFLDAWDPADADHLDNWSEMAGSTLVFKLDGAPGFLHDRDALRAIWQARLAEENDAETRQCLVTGERAPAALLHPPVKGVPGAQPSGAQLVSFNAEAFCSYGQGVAGKGLNAPVSQERAFAYTTALHDLLRRGGGHTLQLGETTVVFWAASDTPYETAIPAMFGGNRDTSGLSEAARARLDGALARIAQGREPGDDLTDTEAGLRFYVLGLAAPSQARLTVRFWLVTTLGHLLAGIRAHAQALQLQRRFDREPATPSIWRLIAETAQDRDLNNAQPGLHTGLLRAILTGGPYPPGLLAKALERVRAECGSARVREDPINHARAALIKAVLQRAAQPSATVPPEVTRMTLDTESTDVPYRLGRLFAAMEKAQIDAQGQSLNRTLRDSYFATASAAPRAVFPRLLRLTQHHISKAEYGGVSDRRIAEIVEAMTPDTAFPPQLTMEQQGRFVLGYYHQRNAFYRKSGETDHETPTSEEEPA